MVMRVLITGGAGFIGSHLCDTLVADGHQVSIIDNLITGSQENIAHLKGKIRVFKGDIRDTELVKNLVNSTDLVLHMAAAVGVENILQDPIESISTNFYGSEIVINAALEKNVRIIISSTSEIYGKNPNQPLEETADRIIGTPQKLRWTYSDAKALEEAMAYHLYKTRGLKVTILRFFNTVGPRQSGKYGMVVPRFVAAALHNEPLKVFGNGSQSRVFCHVFDTIDCIKSIINSDNTIGETFNVGGQNEITIVDLAKSIIKQLNSSSKIDFLDYTDAYGFGFEDMERRVPDLNKINRFTGWTPKLNLNRIIGDVAEYLNYKNLVQP